MKNIVITLAAVTALALAACNTDRDSDFDSDWAGTHPPTTDSSPYSNRVIEYSPAPGQFINNSFTGFDGSQTDSRSATEYADRRLHSSDTSQRGLVSLGGFGGYIVVGFDHSIQSSGGGYDFSITSNQFAGSSEAGVVWVMADDNANNIPDEVWYELRGSHYDQSLHNYSVTYFRPEEPTAPVRWRDNHGNEGEMVRVKTHPQPYFPAWINDDSFTLTGTLLPDLSSTNANGLFSTGDYDWGYADNWGSDMQPGEGQKNFFRISDAVNSEGIPVELPAIDFIKVQTGVNANGDAGVGELSTEVIRFRDEGMSGTAK